MIFSCPAFRPVAPGNYSDFDVVVRSFVSLSRNVAGRRFPHAMSKEESAGLAAVLAAAARTRGFELARVDDLDTRTRSLLAERELFSRPYLLDEHNYVALSPESPLWLAINDTSHLSARASRPGLDLVSAWNDVSGADDSLGDIIGQGAWAFDPGLGYLMPEASFCGSGLSAHVSLHTPALIISGLAEMAFKRAMEAGFIVGGSYSSIDAAGGSLFDLTLPPVYRDPEPAALFRLESAARALADYERRAREQLLSGASWDILDVIGRAAGRASGSRLVSRDEAADIVSGLRLGLATGVLEGVGLEELTELWPALRGRFPELSGGTPGQAGGRPDFPPDEPEAASRARAIRQAAANIRFSQRYKDV